MSSFDWSKCIFCQRVIPKNKTVCPADSKRSDVGSGYTSLEKTVRGYADIGKVPPDVNVDAWDEGDGIEATCKRRRACWHTSCRQKLHTTRLDRMQAASATASTADADAGDTQQGSAACSDIDFPCKVPRLSRTVISGENPVEATCFFCNKRGNDLRQVMTFQLDQRVRSCASIIGDTVLTGKLVAGGDMIASEAKYHPGCLMSLYRKANKMSAHTELSDSSVISVPNSESLAMAEVISYIEDARYNEETPQVYKLSELGNLYAQQLQKHGIKVQSKVNTSRFKDRLLAACPDLTAVAHGRDVLLTFNEHLGAALIQITGNPDGDAVKLVHTAKLVRGELFSGNYTFNGTFEDSFSNTSVPQTLLTLISMLLEGPGIYDTPDTAANNAAISIAQLIIFNAVKHQRKQSVLGCSSQARPNPVAVRHPLTQETAVPVYLAMKIHSSTRNKKIVDKCHNLGLSVSYDRVLQITNKIANSVCDEYRQNDLVCPPCLRTGLFTVAAADNIDHNLSSSTANASFHGTGLSLMQFPQDTVSEASQRCLSFTDASSSVSDLVLPTYYTDIQPCVLPQKLVQVPNIKMQISESSLRTVCTGELQWLDTVQNSLDTDTAQDDAVSWAAFHAESDKHVTREIPITALLPLFRYNANTAAMIRHTLLVTQKAVHFLNAKQIPVVYFDQPLYALAKQVQWHWPEMFGEDQFVIMMGGLHIEMASLRMLGHWLEGSGWVNCLVASGLTTSGVADSFINACNVKRTRYAHSVTAAALFICLKRAYNQDCEQTVDEEHKTFEEWRTACVNESAQFSYWSRVLDLELLVLSFIRAIRTGHFQLYLDTLQVLAPWFFALDRANYARWLPVHLRDMLTLQEKHPQIYSQFFLGHFTVPKSNRKFSCMSIDQAHEQLNAVIKGDGGAVGLTENEAALARWVTAGPEVVRTLLQFEGQQCSIRSEFKHHEQTPFFQRRFKDDVAKLVEVFEEETPFAVAGNDDLVVLCDHTIANPVVVTTVRNAEKIGKEQLHKFVSERLCGSVCIGEPLPRNKLPLFNFKPCPQTRSLKGLRLTQLKTDCELFSRLYVACQSRDGDLDEFFRHENHPYPPALSNLGALRFGSKSDLLSCICTDVKATHDISSIVADAMVVDGAVAIQMLQPGCAKTFEEYRAKIFSPFLQSLLQKVQRLDVVFDRYVPDSLKSACREKRGSGVKVRISDNTKIPKNWQQFLRVADNKTALFYFLTQVPFADLCTKTVLMTCDTDVVQFGKSVDTGEISPCSHEEADTRLMLHCLHAAMHGMRRIVVRTVDTDVVVLAIAFFDRLSVEQLWIHFGVGRHTRLIAVHDVAAVLGPQKCHALPVFHALSGCDTVSCFSGKGKKSAWQAWSVYPDVTTAFAELGKCDGEHEISANTVSLLERFAVVIYDRTSELSDLNSCRRQLFTKKCRSLELLPPTSDAFLLHVKRAVLQGVHVWGQSLHRHPQPVCPSKWGWIKEDTQWIPLWMTLPEVSKVCRELIHCSCKKGCTNRCKCVKANLTCTALCHCDNECSRD